MTFATELERRPRGIPAQTGNRRGSDRRVHQTAEERVRLPGLRPKGFGEWWLVLCLLVAGGAFSPSVASFVPNENLLFDLVSYLGGLVALMVFGGKRITRRPRSQWGFGVTLCVLTWIALSHSWSYDPHVTLLNTVKVASLALLAFVICTRVSQERFLAVLCFTSALAAGVGLSLWLGRVGLATDPTLHVFRGVFVQKNVQGRDAAIGFVAGLLLLQLDVRRRPVIIGLTITGLAMIISESGTATVALAAAVGTWFWINRMRRANPATLALFQASSQVLIVATTILAATGLLLPTILSVLGKDDTFSGRTLIWRGVTQAIHSAFWQGYGYGAFWTNPISGPSSSVTLSVGYQGVPHSHDGVLELAAQAGVVAVILCIAGLIPSLRLLLRALSATYAVPVTQVPRLVFLAFLIPLNFSESQLLPTGDTNIFGLIFFVIILWGGDGSRSAEAPGRTHPRERPGATAARQRVGAEP